MPPQGPVPPPMQKHGGRTKYAEGGEVEDDTEQTTPLPPNPFEEVKGPRKPRMPKGPTVPPPVKPFKRGGRHSDAKEDRKIVKGMVKGSALKKYARGGGLPMAGHNTKGGAESGVGRLEMAHTSKR